MHRRELEAFNYLSFDSDSFRAPTDPGGGFLIFRPIVKMPTFDYFARHHLKLTCNHHTVKSPERLLAYGRIAWYAMLRVGRDHDQLETYFAGELLLAEASAQATAEYGWAKSLEALVSGIRHGVVYKGFREEFIPKVLACIAIEDALRPSAHSPATLKNSWPYTRPVSVSRFLNNLLRNPAAE